MERDQRSYFRKAAARNLVDIYLPCRRLANAEVA